MKLIIDIPEYLYEAILEYPNVSGLNVSQLESSILHGTPIPDNATNGKEAIIRYCLYHNGEEIYNFLKQIFNASMSWTDSRGFIIEWLENGGMSTNTGGD